MILLRIQMKCDGVTFYVIKIIERSLLIAYIQKIEIKVRIRNRCRL